MSEEQVVLKGYNLQNTKKEENEKVRQLSITGHGKLKPALVITNDFELSQEELVRKYSRRWLVEKGISEQIEFFHLNRVSSSMVIKVDFDLTMSILAHNLYRMYAGELERYEHVSDLSTLQIANFDLQTCIYILFCPPHNESANTTTPIC